jgi:hypothetical protein
VGSVAQSHHGTETEDSLALGLFRDLRSEGEGGDSCSQGRQDQAQLTLSLSVTYSCRNLI